MICLRCGYDLSHTPATAPCPECGLAAERSTIDSRHPDDAPPLWVRSIAWATLLLLAAYLVPILIFTVEGAAFQLDHYNGGPPLLIVSLMLTAMLAHWIANVLLSRDDRPRPTTLPRWLHRWLLRVLPLGPLASVLIGAFLLALLTSGQMFKTSTRMASVQRLNLTSGGLMLLLIVIQPLTFLRLRWLATRLNRPQLAEHIGIVAIGLGSSLLAVALIALPAMAAIHVANLLFVLLVALPWALLAMFSLWSVILLFWICPLFFRSARTAQARWLAADAARPLSMA